MLYFICDKYNKDWTLTQTHRRSFTSLKTRHALHTEHHHNDGGENKNGRKWKNTLCTHDGGGEKQGEEKLGRVARSRRWSAREGGISGTKCVGGRSDEWNERNARGWRRARSVCCFWSATGTREEKRRAAQWPGIFCVECALPRHMPPRHSGDHPLAHLAGSDTSRCFLLVGALWRDYGERPYLL